jgi:co-chaperonin GroES (HSP10)
VSTTGGLFIPDNAKERPTEGMLLIRSILQLRA